MTEARDLFITGLKNAHAMESQAHEMLERQIGRTGDFPELKERLQQHFSETKQQLTRLERCLADLDSAPSTTKDLALSFGANVAALGHALASDEVLKNTFASSALEAYEIAAYKSLLILAEQAGVRTTTPLQDSLREEERMAEWLTAHVGYITQAFIRSEQKAA